MVKNMFSLVKQMPWAWWNNTALVAKTMKLQMASQHAWDIYLKDLSPEEKPKCFPRPSSKDFAYFEWQVRGC